MSLESSLPLVYKARNIGLKGWIGIAAIITTLGLAALGGMRAWGGMETTVNGHTTAIADGVEERRGIKSKIDKLAEEQAAVKSTVDAIKDQQKVDRQAIDNQLNRLLDAVTRRDPPR